MAGRIGIVSRLIFAAFLLCAGLPSAAHAEKRVALVIGNSVYRSVAPLPNPALRERPPTGSTAEALLAPVFR